MKGSCTTPEGFIKTGWMDFIPLITQLFVTQVNYWKLNIDLKYVIG